MESCVKTLPLILIIIYFLVLNEYIICAKVRVKIYDHRAYHDPIHYYGRGPWKYFGHGYGIDYGYDTDGTSSHEKGYGFVKAFGREFCKDGQKCRPPDPNFWKSTTLQANGYSPEPYFAHPPADVMQSSQLSEQSEPYPEEPVDQPHQDQPPSPPAPVPVPRILPHHMAQAYGGYEPVPQPLLQLLPQPVPQTVPQTVSRVYYEAEEDPKTIYWRNYFADRNRYSDSY